jgi:hypothetical protein
MANDIRTVGVQLMVEPESVTLDREGRISFSDSRIIQALVAAVPTDLVAEKEAPNYFQCGANNYQCGRATATTKVGAAK